MAAQRAVSSNKRCKGNEAVKECCLGKRISYCGFYWCLAVDYENFIAKGPIRCRIIKRIIKLDPDTLEILNCYENAADATRACNGAVNSSSIINCCKGKQTTAYGYKWRYEEESII